MIVEKMLRWVVILGIFALPFIVLFIAQSLFFPFITGKNFAFRIIVEIITGAWLALALVYPKYRPRRSWLLGAFALFVLIIAIADAQGVNPFKSFWSNFERMDGWVTLAHLLAYITLAASILNTEKLWRRLWQVSLGVSVVVAVYGFLQVFGVASLTPGFSSIQRIDATFGNPIYLAVYMLFNVFIAALLWTQMHSERPKGERLPLSIAYGTAIVLDTIALFFTGTRGTILGLIGGTVLALLLFAFLEGSRRTRTIALFAVVAVVVVGGGLKLAENTAFVKSIGFLDRLASISLSDSTIQARFLNMGIAWQGVRERPILGWGQENYAIVFDKYYDPRMYGQEAWFDRVHDIIFDWWIAGGTLGLLAYLSIFAAALWVIWRGSGFRSTEKSILTGLLAGYFIHNLTVFDNVTSYILFGGVAAYIAWRAEEARQAPPIIAGRFLSPRALPVVALVAAVAVWGVAWEVNAGALAQNRALIQAISPQQGGILQNLAYFKQSIAYGSFGTQEAREQLAQAAAQVAQTASVSTDAKQQFFDSAVREMQLQALASPMDARFPLFLGILLDSFGDYKDAALALTRAHELSPAKQSILLQIGQNEEARGDIGAALKTFATAYSLDTEDQDARLFYAATAIRAKDDALADQLLAPIIPSGDAADARIALAYVARSRFDKVETIWIARIASHPDDVQAYFTLAAAYYQGGNSPKAIEILGRAETVSPSIKSQADSLIQQIRAGTAKIQ